MKFNNLFSSYNLTLVFVLGITFCTVFSVINNACYSKTTTNIENNTRDYNYEHYCDSIYESDYEYYLDVLVESDEYQDYIEKNGKWWN